MALYHHPDDDRYAHLAGATAWEPLSGREVPILADREVDRGYGTGLMMVCTFGDGHDVVRWRRDGLATRLLVTGNGRLGQAAGEFEGCRSPRPAGRWWRGCGHQRERADRRTRRGTAGGSAREVLGEAATGTLMDRVRAALPPDVRRLATAGGRGGLHEGAAAGQLP